jgi:hypothetical protein
MEQRSEDLLKQSIREMVGSVIENRAWGKQLRIDSRILVNSRLEKRIDADVYVARRKLMNENVAECTRRGIVLLNEITLQEREGRRSS